MSRNTQEKVKTRAQTQRKEEEPQFKSFVDALNAALRKAEKGVNVPSQEIKQPKKAPKLEGLEEIKNYVEKEANKLGDPSKIDYAFANPPKARRG